MVQNNKGHQEFNYRKIQLHFKRLSCKKVHPPFCHRAHHWRGSGKITLHSWHHMGLEVRLSDQEKKQKLCMESTLKWQPKCLLIYTRNHLGEDNRTAGTCQSVSRCLHFKHKPREHTWSNAVGSVPTQKQASFLTCLSNNLMFPLLRPKPMSLMPHPLESLSQVTNWSHLKEGFSLV